MNKELFIRKIQQLNDDQLLQLLRLRSKENAEIIDLAGAEATRRGIDLSAIKLNSGKSARHTKSKKTGFSWTEFLAQILPGP